MNDTEIERIAGAINTLRPDWPTSSIRTVLRRPELAGRSRRDVAVALAWVACESETKTPARVIEPGPWWHAANVDGQANRQPPRRDQECRKHAGQWAGHCSGCRSDQLAATPYGHDETPPDTTGWDAARIRAEIHAHTQPKETP